MYVTINGQLGSGKSEVCRLLKEQHGFDVFSTGRIQREYAKELGLNILDFNKLAQSDFSYDYEIDARLRAYAEKQTELDIIFDSRMAWHFVPNAFKVHLLVAPDVAADRVFHNRNTSTEEHYFNKESAMNDLVSRKKLEEERYFSVYSVVISDYNNYDLILDTTALTPDEMCDIIYIKCKEHFQGKATKNMLVCPRNIYPTEKASTVCQDSVGTSPEHIKVDALKQLTLLQVEEAFYILEGHGTVVAANLDGKALLAATVCCQGQDLMPTGKKAVDCIKLSLSDVHDWERLNGFSYGYYPDIFTV